MAIMMIAIVHTQKLAVSVDGSLACNSPSLLVILMPVCMPGCRYGNMSDATKAMQQIDGLEIGNQKVSVKIVALTPAETAAAAVAAHVDLDDAEGAYADLCL